MNNLKATAIAGKSLDYKLSLFMLHIKNVPLDNNSFLFKLIMDTDNHFSSIIWLT